jgi:hypothetical protein
MTPARRPEVPTPQTNRLRLAAASARRTEDQAAGCLLWGWPVVLAKTTIPRRTLEREIAAGRFPKPIRRVGRRPF